MRRSHALRWCQKLGASVICVAATPTMSTIVAGCVDQKVYAFDGDGSEIWVNSFDNEVWSVACTADTNYYAVGTANKNPSEGTVYILNFAGDVIASFPVGAPVWSLAFSPSGLALAASTWAGNCHLYKVVDNQWREEHRITISGAGAYGVRFTDENTIAVVGYGSGVYFLGSSGEALGSVASDIVGYNLTQVGESGLVYVGCRNGTILKIQRQKDGRFNSATIELPGVTRPVSGISASGDGTVIVTGSFDGRLRIVDESGFTFWETDLIGEIWSVAVSPNATQLVVGTGDGRILFFYNTITPDNVLQLRSHLRTLSSNAIVGDRTKIYNHALEFMADLGLVSYALRFIRDQKAQNIISQELFVQLVRALNALCPEESDEHCELSFELGQISKSLGEYWEAAAAFVRAARSPRWRLRGFSEAANAFYRAGHQAAALSCFRRAREPLLGDDDLRIIYTLARSFEDLGHTDIARDHLDIIMVQNPDYRDVASRLHSYRSLRKGKEQQRIDYTGVTVNLLGPDVPSMNIDPKLSQVIKARSNELGISNTGKDEYKAIIEDLYERGILQSADTKHAVEYNRKSYIKYDFLLPEDDVKKKLEAVNLIAISRRVKELRRSLDVGTATGRYPGILMSLGVDSYGVDVEKEAIEYAKTKFPAESCPKFSIGDARALPFDANSFDLVTCMMGTFFHILLSDQTVAAREMIRVCRPGGIVAISTWDIECAHLTYLSMYSANEKELITKNATTIDELKGLLRSEGLQDIDAVRLSLVPDTISYDLGVEKLSVDGVKRLLEIDIATRKAMPDKHGQMFIAFGTK